MQGSASRAPLHRVEGFLRGPHAGQMLGQADKRVRCLLRIHHADRRYGIANQNTTRSRGDGGAAEEGDLLLRTRVRTRGINETAAIPTAVVSTWRMRWAWRISEYEPRRWRAATHAGYAR